MVRANGSEHGDFEESSGTGNDTNDGGTCARRQARQRTVEGQNKDSFSKIYFVSRPNAELSG